MTGEKERRRRHLTGQRDGGIKSEGRATTKLSADVRQHGKNLITNRNPSFASDLVQNCHHCKHMLFCDTNQNLQAHISLSLYCVQVCAITTGKGIHHVF